MNRLLFSLIAILTLVLGGCSSTTTTAPPVKKEVLPPEPVSGQKAVFEMYKAARQWAGDAQLISMENINLDEVKPEPGKYGAWRATFVSVSKKLTRDFSYGVIESLPIRQGTYSTNELTYAPRTQVRIFPILQVKTDTPEVLETAKKQAKDLLAKDPDIPIQFRLEWSGSTPRPAWRVIFGEGLSQSKGSVFVDCETGDFMRKMR